MSTLSLTGKKWIVHHSALHKDPQELLAYLLQERSIAPQRAQSTLTPIENLHDVQKAVQRIFEALRTKQIIGVFGDYDCDGITATAQLVRFFQRHGAEPVVILPHRVHDGYGLSDQIISAFVEKGTELLITADCGIRDTESVARARTIGMDVIVTDHHAIPNKLPDAYALVHPELSQKYPPPYPSGAGVVLRLIEALENGSWEDSDTDRVLAMMGTVADLVELRGDNRTIVQQGLTAFNRLDRDCPLRILLNHANVRASEITSTDVAFRIAPRINAAGRMENPNTALMGLLYGGSALESLTTFNVQRQHLTDELYEELLCDIDQQKDGPLLWSASAQYPEGIVGLLAGKLTQEFGKPSLVASVRGRSCVASLRSPSSYHITNGLDSCAELFLSYGGHAQAAGCTFDHEHLDSIANALSKDIQKTVQEELLPTILIDAPLSQETVTFDFCKTLDALEPFGQGNPQPRFLLSSIQIEAMRRVGHNGKHLQGSINGIKIIGFGLGPLMDELDQSLDIACTIGVNTWMGLRQPQIFVNDIRTTQKVAIKQQ